MARTKPSAPGPVLKSGSTVPSTFSRAMKFRAVPFIRVNSPPTNTLPSACKASA